MRTRFDGEINTDGLDETGTLAARRAVLDPPGSRRDVPGVGAGAGTATCFRGVAEICRARREL